MGSFRRELDLDLPDQAEAKKEPVVCKHGRGVAACYECNVPKSVRDAEAAAVEAGATSGEILDARIAAKLDVMRRLSEGVAQEQALAKCPHGLNKRACLACYHDGIKTTREAQRGPYTGALPAYNPNWKNGGRG